MQGVQLVLEDGSRYRGFSFGAKTSAAGEVVFNTGMVGYPETLTDPSYKGQILVLTYPLVGNYGIPADTVVHGLLQNFESEKIQISGLVISDYSFQYDHWSSIKSLDAWMQEHGIPGMYGVDTRAVTKRLREKGAMLGKMMVNGKDNAFFDPNKINIVEHVSIQEPKVYGKGNLRVVVVDCGVKLNIIRSLLKRGVKVIRVPWDYNFFDMDFDGIVISNGPGDPTLCTTTIHHMQKAMKENIPIFGICLGNQILALAAGAKTYKLKYGHRGQNQPCLNLDNNRCFVTSQNHGFAVEEKTLPQGWEPWFRNANDSTNEGIRHKRKPFFSVQFHPEANPGPKDTAFLFDQFVEMIR
ncbi:glutamine-hydrolyzing carbamoyl-phosphate synthase small subunit [Candidatus Woesearchaeota archaeon]|nr:glutamine-hydrolyzing carbamoyl-phosphate synthase small subunit [Candidatus Woesearchaeota archaeon]